MPFFALLLSLLIFAFPLSGYGQGNTHGTPNAQQELQAWFGDRESGYVQSGCLPAVPGGSLTYGAIACQAYLGTVGTPLTYVDQPTKAIGPLSDGNGTYWLGVHRDTTTAAPGCTRQAQSFYFWCKSSTLPTGHGGMIFNKTTVAGGVITAAYDYRIPRSYATSRVYDLTDPLYGGVGDAVVGGSGTDNKAAMDKAINAAAQKGGILYIPAGRYNFESKPNALYNGITIRCVDQRNTVLVRKYSEATAGQGFIDMDVAHAADTTASNSGGGIENCTLYAETATTGGSAVNIQSSAATGQGFIRVDRMYITGVGSWNYGVRMDGSLKTSDPEGVRGVWVNDTFVFQADLISYLALGFNHIHIRNSSAFTTTSGGANECLVADSGTASTIASEDLTVQLGFCSAGVRIGSANVLPISNINLFIPHTTILTVAANVSNLAYLGDASTTSGLVSVGDSTHVSQWVPGRILVGVNAPTTGGARVETANGITFPATQVVLGQRNTLDDFEKDTWTPTVYASSTAGTTTYLSQKGYYTKIANLVCVSSIVAWSNQTGSGNLRMSLPFPPKNDNGNYAIPLNVIAHNLVVGAGKQLAAGVAVSGQAEVIFYAIDVDAGGSLAQVALDTEATVYVGGCYHTDL